MITYPPEMLAAKVSYIYLDDLRQSHNRVHADIAIPKGSGISHEQSDLPMFRFSWDFATVCIAHDEGQYAMNPDNVYVPSTKKWVFAFCYNPSF